MGRRMVKVTRNGEKVSISLTKGMKRQSRRMAAYRKEISRWSPGVHNIPWPHFTSMKTFRVCPTMVNKKVSGITKSVEMNRITAVLINTLDGVAVGLSRCSHEDFDVYDRAIGDGIATAHLVAVALDFDDYNEIPWPTYPLGTWKNIRDFVAKKASSYNSSIIIGDFALPYFFFNITDDGKILSFDNT